ncbi:winged helix-turn-helix domain-containing protein [Streptomyces sp. NRRL B-24572]|uniref:winged helix-turn-helix domain-containing protein n=1 Tax=Streptomyces sp. NRRL B-24572 TaxID=1962156 RepID=UPI003590056F
MLKRHGWSWQQPTRRAIERDDAAVELWKRKVWPWVRTVRRRATAGLFRLDLARLVILPEWRCKPRRQRGVGWLIRASARCATGG